MNVYCLSISKWWLNVGSSCNQLFSEVVGRGKYPLCNSQHISLLHLKILVDANYLNTRLWHLLRDYCLNFLWTSNLLGLFQSKKLIQMKRYFASIVHHQNGWSSIPSLSESAGGSFFFKIKNFNWTTWLTLTNIVNTITAESTCQNCFECCAFQSVAKPSDSHSILTFNQSFLV